MIDNSSAFGPKFHRYFVLKDWRLYIFIILHLLNDSYNYKVQENYFFSFFLRNSYQRNYFFILYFNNETHTCLFFKALEQDVTDSSNYLERLVNEQKKSIEGILNSLLLFEERLKQNLQIKLDELEADALLDVYSIINATYEYVNVSIIHFYHI